MDDSGSNLVVIIADIQQNNSRQRILRIGIWEDQYCMHVEIAFQSPRHSELTWPQGQKNKTSKVLYYATCKNKISRKQNNCSIKQEK